MAYPSERRAPNDVYPGMMFVFAPDSFADDGFIAAGWTYTDTYMIVSKHYQTYDHFNGYPRPVRGGFMNTGRSYLLVGPGSRLREFQGGLGLIRRIVDPVFELS